MATSALGKKYKNSALFLSLAIIAAVAIVFLALIFLLKPSTKAPVTSQNQASTSAKANGINLHYQIIGSVVSIDSANHIVTVETFDTPQKKYQVKIPAGVTMTRPPAIKEGDDPNTAHYPPIVAKFEELRIGSVLSVLSVEDPGSTNNLTARGVEVEV